MLHLIDQLRLWELVRSSGRAVLYLLPFLLAVYLLEWRGGADRARYRTRQFLSDAVYSLFYWGGFYNVFVLAALANALAPRLDALKLNLLAAQPWPVQLVVFWVLGDFLTYWMHRLQHRWRWLWAFHSVHHTQTQLTSLTGFRRHPVERLFTDIVVFFGVLQLVLGVQTRQWLPLTVLITAFQALQHAELDWHYGVLEKLIVSPTFHAIHHSPEARHYDRNYGQLLSVWDFLFGTAAEDPRPTRYGVEGLDMKESVVHQLAAPFRYLWRGYTVPPASSKETTRKSGKRGS